MLCSSSCSCGAAERAAANATAHKRTAAASARSCLESQRMSRGLTCGSLPQPAGARNPIVNATPGVFSRPLRARAAVNYFFSAFFFITHSQSQSGLSHVAHCLAM